MLHCLPTLERSAGGLAVAVNDLCGHLADHDEVDVKLLTAASELNARVPVSSTVSVREAPSPGLPGLLPLRSTGFWNTLTEIHNEAPLELIHQHGLWRPAGHLVCRFARERQIPLVISPHGMLEPWALKHRRWKKQAAWLVYQGRDLNRATGLHAASGLEAEQIRRLGFKQPLIVIPHGVTPLKRNLEDKNDSHESSSDREALFLSRLHPKKGIPLLLNAWAKVRPEGWKLVIAGGGRPGYIRRMKNRARRLGIESHVRFPGELHGKEKDAAFRRADLFILPSWSENFGIVVAEALQYGLPVLTTTGTPWRTLEAEGCGWWVEPTDNAIATALHQAIDLPPQALREMGSRGVALVNREFRWGVAAERMLAFYRWLLNKGDRPEGMVD